MALSDLELDRLFSALATPTAVRDLVRARRRGGPVRRVHGGRSVMGRYASRKMGVTVQSESRSLEAPACTIYEHDPEVLEYYDQPCELRLAYAPAGSARRTSRHVPDFLVVRRGEIALEEWKASEALTKLAVAEPLRFLRQRERWRHAPAEDACAQLGIAYRLRTESDLPALLVRNWRILGPFAQAPVDPASSLIAIVREHPGCTIQELLEASADAEISDVLPLLAAGAIWTDLQRVLLTQHDQVHLFSDEERGRLLQAPIALVPTGAVSLAPKDRVLWSGVPWTVLNAAPETLTLADDGGAVQTLRRAAALELVRLGELRQEGSRSADRADLLREVAAANLEIATQRLAALRPYLESYVAPRTRTHQRWLRRYHEARSSRGDGLLGLVPNYDDPAGGRRVGGAAIELAHQVIRELALTRERRPYHSGYTVYAQRCRDAGVVPVSRPTYRKELAALARGDDLRRRLGRKASNALASPRPASPFPVHGDRAFERVHVDHTLLDVVLRDSVNGDEIGRPWLTLAVDAFTRRIVGHVLTFDPPSSATVLLVLRDIVSRYQRLPAVFVLDNGSEFKSTYMQTIAAAFNVSIEYRPPGDPRFGSVVESCFGKADRDLVHFLRGNTVGRKDVRAQDPANDASRLAVWTLPELEGNLSRYFYEVYDVMRSPSMGLSPRERYEQSVKAAGLPPGDAIAYDQDFLVMTALPLAKRVTVSRQGVKAGNVRYWCDAFDRPGVRDSKVDVRHEPFDRSTAYAFIDGHWERCRSNYTPLLEGRSDREIRLASMELTSRLKRAPSTRELALHLESTLQTERLLLERRRQRERALAQPQNASAPDSAPVEAETPPRDPIDEEPVPELEEWAASA